MHVKVSSDQRNEIMVREFMELAWNQNDFTALDQHLHSDFIDHSMPYEFLQNKTGLVLYLTALNKNIHHYSIIEEMVCTPNFVMAEILICGRLKDPQIALEQNDEILKGIRLFKIENEKIKEHWEFIN